MAFLVIGVALLLLAVSIRLTAWGRRTSHWMQELAGSAVGYEGASFSDMVGFAGFGLTVVGIALGWFTVTLQNRKATIDSQIRDATDRVSSERVQVRETRVVGQGEFARDIDIHLDAPVHNAHLIGQQIEFSWKYTKHSRNLGYRIELIKLDPDHKNVDRSRLSTNVNGECDFSKSSSCVFYANEPSEQRSILPLCSAPDGGCKTPVSREWEGSYIWRVVPVRAESSKNEHEGGRGSPDVSDWSEYGSFDIYSGLMRRMARSHPATVRVGTTYADNRHFSTRNEYGEPAGYDVDLINVLVSGCMATNPIESDPRAIEFDATDCYEAVEDYEEMHAHGRRDNAPQVEIIPFASVNEGLSALRRKEIDVFIGSVTWAVGRENEGVQFTDGYFDFETGLYTHVSSPEAAASGGEGLSEWAASKRSIGVIENSTNHWLGTSLAATSSLHQQISIVAFPTYAALASAFQRGAVDGVLIDNVLSNDLVGVTPSTVVEVRGLDRTSAWSDYHKRIGAKHEHFAIAVATEIVPSSVTWAERMERQLRQLMNAPDASYDVGGLYPPLQEALRFVDSERFRCTLRERNDVPIQRTSKDDCKKYDSDESKVGIHR